MQDNSLSRLAMPVWVYGAPRPLTSTCDAIIAAVMSIPARITVLHPGYTRPVNKAGILCMWAGMACHPGLFQTRAGDMLHALLFKRSFVLDTQIRSVRRS